MRRVICSRWWSTWNRETGASYYDMSIEYCPSIALAASVLSEAGVSGAGKSRSDIGQPRKEASSQPVRVVFSANA